MSERMDKSALAVRVADRLGEEAAQVERILDAALEEIYASMKVALRSFGTFYVDRRTSDTVFKFNPSQKWRKLFGWSSSYRGEL